MGDRRGAAGRRTARRGAAGVALVGLGLAGLGLAVVVAAAALAVVRWGPGGHSCADAVPTLSPSELQEVAERGGSLRSGIPEAYAPDDLLDGVVGTHLDRPGDEASDVIADRYEPQIAALLAPGGPFGRPTLALLDVYAPELTPQGDVVLTHGVSGQPPVSLHDGRDGSLLWARDQQGTGGYGWAGDAFVLVQADDDRPLSVAVVEPASGDVRSCTALGAPPGLAADGLLPFLALDDGVVTGRPEDGDRLPLLSRLDVRAGADDDVAWERAVERSERVGEVTGSAAVVVHSAVGADPIERARILREDDSLGSQGARSVHAVDPDSGRPLWSYPAEPPTGDDPWLHSPIGVHGQVVVVAADRARGADERPLLQTSLVGLDAVTGDELWSVELADRTGVAAWETQLFGDLVVTVDAAAGDHGESGELVAIDVGSGEELWRLPDRTHVVAKGARVDDLLLLPRRENLQGVDAVEAGNGEQSLLFDGLTVTQITNQGGLLGVRTGPLSPAGTRAVANVFVVYETG